MSSITHPVDPACPYCRSAVDIAREVAERNKKQADMEGKTGRVPGSERTLVAFHDGRPKVPAWVDMSIQPESVRRALKEVNKNGS